VAALAEPAGTVQTSPLIDAALVEDLVGLKHPPLST